MKTLVCILLLAVSVCSLSAYWFSSTSQNTATSTAKPQPVKQDITVVYGYMTFSEAETLGCVQIQAGWACQLVGAGGGHAFKD